MNSFAELSLERNQGTLCATSISIRNGGKGIRVRRFSDTPTSRRYLDDAIEHDDDYKNTAKRDDSEVMGDKLNESALIYQLKPMPKLRVCPVDDSVLEEEKKRRRSQKRIPERKDPLSLRHFESSFGSIPKIGRDGMTIRHQYWSQLGINPTRRELERSSKRSMQRKKGLKVTLNDVEKDRSRDKSILDLFVNWYSSNGKKENRNSSKEDKKRHASCVLNEITPIDTQSDIDDGHITSHKQKSTTSDCNHLEQAKASVRFNHEAELFYIPIHKEYTKHQRNCIWHTREEFVSMVERNLESLYEEMELEVSDKTISADDTPGNDDDIESKEATISDSGVSDEADQPNITMQQKSVQIDTMEMAKTNINSLIFIPNDVHVKVSARARSSHDIRFKYLKHLGIDT
ncbi:hypothetical protein ABG067_000102 [Albugo candida]